VSFAAITLCVASQRVFIVVVYFVVDSVRKLLDTPSYVDWMHSTHDGVEYRDFVMMVVNLRVTFQQRIFEPMDIYQQFMDDRLNLCSYHSVYYA
jgi:hypothetical protein